MNAVLSALLLVVAAPLPKEKNPNSDYLIVHATCLSSIKMESIVVESTFVISKEGSGAPLDGDKRFKVRYIDAASLGVRSTYSYLFLPEFQPGDRSYWVVKQEPNLEYACIYRRDILKKVLPNPYHLIHPLCDQQIKARRDDLYPNESTTKNFMLMVKKGMELESSKSKIDFAKEHSDKDCEFIKTYLRWLIAEANASKKP